MPYYDPVKNKDNLFIFCCDCHHLHLKGDRIVVPDDNVAGFTTACPECRCLRYEFVKDRTRERKNGQANSNQKRY